MQAEPNYNTSIDDGHAAFYLDPNPQSLYVPRSSQNDPVDHHQNFNFTMQVANENCPATTGYTPIPLFPSYPYYGIPDPANAYQPIPSLWQTRFDQRTFVSANPVGDRPHPENFENALVYQGYDQPCVQSNYHHMTWHPHDNISSERKGLSHSGPQSISQLQTTNFTSANADFPPELQEQPTQNKPVQCLLQLPLPFAPTARYQGNSKRARKFWSELKASSGIVFASQLQPGQSPSKPIELSKLRRAGRVRDVSCPICGALFATPYHLQSHFPVCVRRNGNPDGLFWDEALSLRWRRYGKCDTIRAEKFD